MEGTRVRSARGGRRLCRSLAPGGRAPAAIVQAHAGDRAEQGAAPGFWREGVGWRVVN